MTDPDLATATGNGAYDTPSNLKKSSKTARTAQLQEQVYLQTELILPPTATNTPERRRRPRSPRAGAFRVARPRVTPVVGLPG